MRTEDLIVRLVADARPVNRLAPVHVRFTRWVLAVAIVAAVSLVIGARPDASVVIGQPLFAIPLFLTMAAMVTAGLGAVRSGVPGADQPRWAASLPIVAGVAWIGWLAVRLAREGSALERLGALPYHTACALEIWGLSVVPAWILIVMVRRAAPLRPRWSALMTVLAAAAAAAAATQVICPVDDPAHQLVGHVGPALLLVAVGMFTRMRPRTTATIAAE